MKAKELARQLRTNPEAEVLVMNPATGTETDDVVVTDLGSQLLIYSAVEEEL